MNWYINRLKDKNYDVKKWLLEDIIRLFGIAVSLRDEDSNLNQKQILKFLQEDDERRERSRQEDLNPIYPQMLTDKELEKKYKKEKELYQEKIKELEKDKNEILNCELEINNLQMKLRDCKEDLIKNMLFKAKKFLDSAKHDVDWDISFYKRAVSESESFGKYRARYIGNIKSQITYLNKLKEEAKQKVPRYKSYAEDYKNLIKLIMEAK